MKICESEDPTKELLDNLYQTIKYLHEHIDEEGYQLDDLMKTAERLERISKCSKRVCDEMTSVFARSDVDVNQVNEFSKKRFDELMEMEMQKPVERYETLRSVAIGRVVPSKLDPFTKEKIRTPLLNKRCGHVYDKVGVTKMLEQGKSVGLTQYPCAVMGCANRSIEMEDMEPYLEFFAMVDEGLSHRFKSTT